MIISVFSKRREPLRAIFVVSLSKASSAVVSTALANLASSGFYVIYSSIMIATTFIKL